MNNKEKAIVTFLALLAMSGMMYLWLSSVLHKEAELSHADLNQYYKTRRK